LAKLLTKSGIDFINLGTKIFIMSVAEMKLAAINEISKLTSENAVKEILEHLIKIAKEERPQFDADVFFEKTSEKYDDVLQKLAQ
jgi:hypothetical protein